MKPRLPIQLSIPNPCHEDWAQMTPDERGRFCSHCQKSVVDFTTWSDAQIHQYISAHAGERVCGRMSVTQIGRPLSIAIPLRKRPAAMQWLAAGVVLLLAISPMEMKAITHDNITVTSEIQDGNMPDSAVDSIIISGIVLDEKTQPVLAAIIELKQNGKVIGESTTNEDGRFTITLHTANLEKTNIVMQVIYTSYITKIIKEVPYNKSTSQIVRLELNASELMGAVLIQYKVPLIDPFEPTKRTITSEEIENMAH